MTAGPQEAVLLGNRDLGVPEGSEEEVVVRTPDRDGHERPSFHSSGVDVQSITNLKVFQLTPLTPDESEWTSPGERDSFRKGAP